MGTFGRSFVKSKKFAFSQQIEKFDWQLRRGGYVSPKYYCESTGCNWSLVIESKRERFFGIIPLDYIEIRLKREDYANESQSVDVSFTIVDASIIRSNFSDPKEIHFTSSSDEEIVSRIKKNYLFDGYFSGLNRARYIPNGVLTVKCEITAYEIVEENYESEDRLEDTTKYAKKEILKCVRWWLLLIACLFCYFSVRSGVLFGIFASVITVIGVIVFFGMMEFLVYTFKKIWYFIMLKDEIISNKPRKSRDIKAKTE